VSNNKSSFAVRNPDALTDVLRTAEIATSEPALRKGALAGARIFLDEIKLRAPRRTGNLVDSALIVYDPEQSVAGKIASYIVTFNKKAWYARLIEFGTSKMAAEPFIRPAYEAKKTETGTAVASVIQEEVRNGQ
jgi:HK97 gp10 family phage protein